MPDFDQHGYLPAGIHRCRVTEIVERFGIGSPEREVETQELLQFIEWAKRAGVRRLIINGSFVTDKVDPNDVDVVILPGTDYPRHESPLSDATTMWPFLHVLVAADDADLENWALGDFGTDRAGQTKGVLELIL